VHIVRRLLQWAFGFLALAFGLASVATLRRLPHLVAEFSLSGPSGGYANGSSYHSLVIFITEGLALLIVCLPIPLAALYIATWWTLNTGKPSARAWALTASIVTVIQGIPILWLTFRYQDQMHGALNAGFLILVGTPFLVGIPGIVAFGPRRAAQELVKTAPERIQGDGTSPNLDRFALMLQVATFVVSGEVWWRWAKSRAHSFGGGAGWYLWIAELAVVIFLHELGHVVAGIAGGMKLNGVFLGPFNAYRFRGKWNFRFLRSFASGAAAGVQMIPATPRRNRGAKIFYIAAGPIASLLSGLLFLYWAAAIPAGQSDALWDFFSWTGVISLGVFALNVIPMRSQAFYSDGAKIYQAVTGSVLDDYYWILSLSHSVATTQNRPGDYDLEALRRVVNSEIGRPQRVVFYLMTAECLLERGLADLAAEEVAKAQAAYDEKPEKLTAGTIGSFVFGHAILRADLATARIWSERVEEGFGFSQEDLWLCSASLACAEGRRDEAEAMLEKLEGFQREQHPSGSREFNILLERHMRTKLNDTVELAASVVHADPTLAELANQPG
jgi:hypothetical protein